MKHFFALVLVLLLSGSYAQKPATPAIVIHGGAGVIERGKLSAEKEEAITSALQSALDSAYNILEQGGTAMDAVLVAVAALEDSPWFNAGKGAVKNQSGTHELDASIMDGVDLSAGAVAGVTIVKNPILAAHKVMTASPHVLLSGAGADAFASENALAVVENKYFTTPEVEDLWKSKFGSKPKNQRGDIPSPEKAFSKYGTVGAVAIDANGNIAAGTSTGGMMGKQYNRIGDSPLIGSGTYADNNTCGISCTGHGEYFIRIGAAKDISDQMAYGGATLHAATRHTLFGRLLPMGGKGGIIGIDKEGNITMLFSTPGMYRGYKNANSSYVGIYADDE